MCGILGISIGADDPLFKWARNLFALVQTRGHESWGLVMHDKARNMYVGARGLGYYRNNAIEGIGTEKTIKQRDPIAELGLSDIKGKAIIMHGRLASKGAVTLNNAHPFLSCDGSFAMVHNGGAYTIKIEREKHKIRGETDSEEFMHHIEECLARNGNDWHKALVEAFKIHGTLNTLIVDHDTIHCIADTNMHIVQCEKEQWIVAVNMACSIGEYKSTELKKGVYTFRNGVQTQYTELKSNYTVVYDGGKWDSKLGRYVYPSETAAAGRAATAHTCNHRAKTVQTLYHALNLVHVAVRGRDDEISKSLRAQITTTRKDIRDGFLASAYAAVTEMFATLAELGITINENIYNEVFTPEIASTVDDDDDDDDRTWLC